MSPIHNVNNPIPFSRPILDSQEERAVLRVLQSGWLTTGNESREFEVEFARYINSINAQDSMHAIAVSSATAALSLGISSLNYPEGSIIALSNYTFAATINSILFNRLTPVLIDTVPHGYHLDPQGLMKALENPYIRRNIKGLLLVHFAGFEYAGNEIEEICQHYNIDIIEDAAHSFPAKNSLGKFQGTRGKFGAYSFYANKTITSGEGGMLVTQDSNLAHSVRSMRLHGITKDSFSRYTQISTKASTPSWYYDIGSLGFKFNLPDILACIGRVQLSKAEYFWSRRVSIAHHYLEAFADRDWLTPPAHSNLLNESNHSWHIFSLRLNLSKLNIDRDEFIQKLSERGIGTSVHFIPLHLMSYYKKILKTAENDFPHSLNSFLSTISLPIYPSLSDLEVEKIIHSVLHIGDTHAMHLSKP